MTKNQSVDFAEVLTDGEPAQVDGPELVGPNPDTTPAPAPAPGKRGRPRKWASEAERKRAYNAARKEAREKARQEGKEPAGGPPGGKQAKKQAAQGAADILNEQLHEIREGYGKAETPADLAGLAPPSEAPLVVSGYLLLVAIDAIAPVVVRFLFRRDASTLALTKEERQKVEPLADSVAAELTRGLTPVQMFAGVLLSMYAAKIPHLPKLPPRTRKAGK